MRITLTLLLIELEWILAQVEEDFDKLNELKKKMQGGKWKHQALELTSKFKELLKPSLRLSSNLNIEPYSGSILDYPKPDEFKNLKIFELAWKEYYECLKAQYANIGPDKLFPPQALMIFEGSNMKLNCDLCISPSDLNEPVAWFFSSTMQEELATELEEDGNTIVSQYDNTIHIFNIDKSQSGLYHCHLKNTQSTTYFVHVVDKEPINLVRPWTANKNHSFPPVENQQYKISIYNDWSSWTKCSKCGKVGKKIRTGYCTVILTDNLNIIGEDQNMTSKCINLQQMGYWDNVNSETDIGLSPQEISKKCAVKEHIFNFKICWNELKKIFDGEPINRNQYYKSLIYSNILNNHQVRKKRRLKRRKKILDLNQVWFKSKPTHADESKYKALAMLRIFDNGIPCRSPLLPDSIRKLPEVSMRNTEIMLAYCKEACVESVIFEVYDTKGKIIEEVNNTAGLYSTLQDLPPVQPTVARRSVTVKINYKNLMIICPGNIHENIPIEWQRGKKLLKATSLTEETRGRITIDLLDRITFLTLRDTDTSTYSCWQNKELAGVVTLIIDQKLPFKVNRHVLLLGVLPFAVTFTICLYRVFKLRHRGFA